MAFDATQIKDVEDTAMEIQIVTDAMIEASKIKSVTDPLMLSSGNMPTVDGLFSHRIFGSSPKERMKTYAYIDLQRKFFHPYVYEIIKKLQSNVDVCASGKGAWMIDSSGKLVEVKDPNDPKYNEDNTGLEWLIQQFHKLNFTDTGSRVRAERLQLLKNLTDEEIFISKWLVIPVFYRDIDLSNGKRSIPEINYEYQKLIQYSRALDDDIFSFYNNALLYNMQMKMVNIRQFGQKLIEKKHGIIHRSILGKSIDRGAKDVISVPLMSRYERPEDNPVDIFHIGIPTAKCLVLGYDFIIKYLMDFFTNNFKDVREFPTYKVVDGELQRGNSIPIKDQLQIYTKNFIDKRINQYKNTVSTRFDPVLIYAENGDTFPMTFTGRFQPVARHSAEGTTLINRAMTWTDLFYLACVDSCGDKYVYTTRYPVTGIQSIFPCQCAVLSTIKTGPAWVNGKLYPHYPIVDPNASLEEVSRSFIDTVTMSNLYLPSLGGDYDGDTTIEKMVFSIEANAEAAEIMTSLRHFISAEGKLTRDIGNESYLCLYNMTRSTPQAGRCPEDAKYTLLHLDRKKITYYEIVKLFTTTAKRVDGKIVKSLPTINPQWKVHLKAGEYINKEAVDTTAGIILFNKLFIEGELEDTVPGGFFNEVITKKKFSKLLDLISTAAMEKKIAIDPTVYHFLQSYEFWSLKLVYSFAPSYTMPLIKPNEKLKNARDKKLASLQGADVSTLVKAENELVDMAKQETEGDPGRTLFDSGSRGSFENDYKNMSLAIGATMNPVTNKYEFIRSNYMDGIQKEDLAAAANIVVNGEYPKAIGTAKGGYLTKQFYAAFQSIVLGDKGSDCGTKVGLDVFLTEDNAKDYYDQYVIDGSTTVLLTDDTVKKYLNRNIQVRSPMFCISEKICNRCMGERFYTLDVTAVGLTTTAISGNIMNKSLKLRHSLKVTLNQIDPEKLLL